MPKLAWPLLLAVAALMEVAGDAVVRKGLRDHRLTAVLFGFAIVGAYAVVVNVVRWDFSRLFGVYVAFFATTAVIFGRLVLRDDVPASTWFGLVLIVAGGIVIQLGHSR
jgi:multidrug transporter EmrE-like cation transporter